MGNQDRSLTFCLTGLLALSLGQSPRAIAVPTVPAPPAVEVSAVDRLFQTGSQQVVQGQFRQALQTFQQVLQVRREAGDRWEQGRTLTALGLVHHSLGNYPAAQAALAQAVELARQTKDPIGEVRAMHEQCVVQRKLANYPEAIRLCERAIALSQKVSDRLTEGRTLNELGVIYTNQGDYGRGLEIEQQALTLTRQIGDRLGEGRVLNSIGVIYSQQGEYQQALTYYQQALQIRRELGDRAGEARTLNNLGVVYDSRGDYARALEFYQAALVIRQEIGDRAGEGLNLGNIGLAYQSLGDYNKALEFYQRALEIANQIGDRAGQGYLLTSIAATHSGLGDYAKALGMYEQALTLQRAIGDRASEGSLLNNIGGVYETLGQTVRALEFYQQALGVRRQIGDRAGEGRTLSNLGGIYDSQGQHQQALEVYQQALAIRRQIGDRSGEGITLNNLGLIYSALGQQERALELFQQALQIQRQTGDRTSQGSALSNIGLVYQWRQQADQAAEYYRQALGVFQEIGNRRGEWLALSNLGSVLAPQQPELAIVFYKQSVRVTESIRQDLRSLSRSEQETYTQTVADTYRALANLLLSQQRILEAQQVLELLKVQEIQDFTREVRSTSARGIVTNAVEDKILQQYGSLIAFGQQVEACKQVRCAQLSQLNDTLQELTQQYNQTVQTYEKEIRRRRGDDEAFLDPGKLSKLREIVDAQPGTVLVYPLVLADKIWLVWAAPGGVVKSTPVAVNQQQLGEAVLEFRRLVQDPSAPRKQVQRAGKQLYDWLIQPLAAELNQNRIQHLVFSLDRVTRYIPISALFDGEKYLIENYTVSTVLSADLTNMRDRLPPGSQQTAVLALGASQFPNFNPLPNVPMELDAIVQTRNGDARGVYPGLEFLDRSFDFRTLRDHLLGHKILHIATHGAFVPGRPEESYLVLGTGEKLTIPQIQTLQDLKDIHLVVLSACETALGGPDQDGVEISGLSSYFLNAGAAAVIASLWSVNDASTSQLMQQFYRHLADSSASQPVTKVEALRQAQLSLLYGKASGRSASQRGLGVVGSALPRGTPDLPDKLSHPYYWAPFVLIGNRL